MHVVDQKQNIYPIKEARHFKPIVAENRGFDTFAAIVLSPQLQPFLAKKQVEQVGLL